MPSVLGNIKHKVKMRLRDMYRRTRKSLRTKARVEKDFRSKYFGEQPVDLLDYTEYRNELFPQCGPYAWLDKPDAEAQIDAKEKAGTLSAEEAKQCRKWVRDGYIIIEKAISEKRIDGIWDAYEKAIACGLVKLNPEPGGEGDPYPGRNLNPHLKVLPLDGLLRDPVINKWNKILVGAEPLPFQTITAHKGSQQKTHSDTVHMTTYPLGYLTAAWVAFEDIHPDSGPLVYYPGSHRLPYYLSHEIGVAPGVWRATNGKPYTDVYEPFVEKLVARENLKPAHFCAKKGDVLIWHANLLHGGSKRNDIKHSRKSVVCHYYFKGAVCYHDLAGVKADIDRSGEYDSTMTDMLM